MTHGHGDDLYSYPHIRLNFSSNVYDHHDHSALMAYLASQLSVITHYPEPAPATLERRLAEELHLMSSQVMVTNGATEAIYLTAQAYRSSRTAIVVPAFAEYADACRQYGHQVVSVTSLDGLNEDFHTVWICNPCNPTGIVFEREKLLDTIRCHPHTLFIIDASYAPFTMKPLIGVEEAAEMRNVIMLHSMTKEFAVPGLRLGYVTADPDVLDRLRALQMPWSVNAIAQLAGMWLLNHKQQYTIPVEMLMEERRRVASQLQATGCIDVYPSDTHILLCHLHNGTAAELKDYLANKHSILIRDASNFEGLTQAHFRIAVQTPKENDELIKAIKTYYD